MSETSRIARGGIMENVTAPSSTQDEEHLRLLAIFHYIMGGLGFFISCFPLLHLAIGIAMIASPGMAVRNGEPAPMFVGYLFVVLAAAFILVGWSLALCTVLSGRMIAKRKNRMFSVVVAAGLCMFIPFGTVLGVFTIMVLNKDSVRALYTPASSPGIVRA